MVLLSSGLRESGRDTWSDWLGTHNRWDKCECELEELAECFLQCYEWVYPKKDLIPRKKHLPWITPSIRGPNKCCLTHTNEPTFSSSWFNTSKLETKQSRNLEGKADVLQVNSKCRLKHSGNFSEFLWRNVLFLLSLYQDPEWSPSEWAGDGYCS